MQIAIENLTKKNLRSHFLIERMKLKAEEIYMKSHIICTKVWVNFFLANKVVAIYMPFKNEVNPEFLTTHEMKALSLPCIEGENMVFRKWQKNDLMEKTKFGILQPLSNAKIIIPDVIICPLVSFNKGCYRLGYGGGFYDKYLADFEGLKIGIAFEMKKTTENFQEPLDIRLDYIITEERMYHI
jgi:5-formyltetrahydrofolate cyclo-ligase